MQPVSLYVHVPFCRRTCPYCTFYHAKHDEDLESAFLDRILEELNSYFASASFHMIAGETKLHTLYIGGGSPSVLRRESIEKLIEGIENLFATQQCVERTIEVNPEDVTQELVEALQSTGFTRISVGVQSMNEQAQRTLARCAPSVNRRALSLLRASFDNLSVDLLLGIPGAERWGVRESKEEELLEELLLGLRTREGVRLDRVQDGGDVAIQLGTAGLAAVAGDRLRLTEKGFLLLDEIVLRLAGGISKEQKPTG